MKISICSNYSCLSNETLHPMIIVLHEDIYVGIIVTSAKSLRDILCYIVSWLGQTSKRTAGRD